MMVTATTTIGTPPKYSDDPMIEEFMRWVRYAPLDSDAIANIKTLLKQYDRRKSDWQRFKCLFS